MAQSCVTGAKMAKITETKKKMRAFTMQMDRPNHTHHSPQAISAGSGIKTESRRPAHEPSQAGQVYYLSATSFGEKNAKPHPTRKPIMGAPIAAPKQSPNARVVIGLSWIMASAPSK
jgi:hypothetical protein